MKLRDKDVHFDRAGAERAHKYVPEEQSPFTAMYVPGRFWPATVVEMENPDGTKVSGPVLRGTVGLYIKQEGRLVEARVACREFIDQLGGMLDEVKASLAPKK